MISPDHPNAETVIEWHRALLAGGGQTGGAEAFARPHRGTELTPRVLDRPANGRSQLS